MALINLYRMTKVKFSLILTISLILGTFFICITSGLKSKQVTTTTKTHHHHHHHESDENKIRGFVSLFNNETQSSQQLSSKCLYGPPETIRAAVTAEKTSNYDQNNEKLISDETNDQVQGGLYQDDEIDEKEFSYRYVRSKFDEGHLRISERYKRYPERQYQLSPSTSSLKSNKINNNNDDIKFYKSKHLTQKITYDELVFETIDQINRHRLTNFYYYTYDNQIDRDQSSDPKLTSPKQCRNHLNYLVSQHKLIESSNQHDHVTPELGAWFDSYAKQQSGILTGNVYWVGHHDECIKRHLVDVDKTKNNAPIEIRGRYCVASLQSPAWPQMIEQEVSRRKFKDSNERDQYRRLFRLQLGVCLPQTCDSNSMGQGKTERDMLSYLAKSTLTGPLANYEMIDLYCLPDEQSPLRQYSTSTLTFFAVSFIWLSLIAWATIYDSRQNLKLSKVPDDKLEGLAKFARIMSFRANFNKFMKCDSNNNKSNAHDKCAETEKNINLTRDSSESDKSKTQDAKDAETYEHNISNSIHESDYDNSTISESKTKFDETKNNTDNCDKNENQSKLDLGFLSAIKALAMLWIINGHIMLLMIQTSRNILDSDSLLTFLMHFLIGATFGVDLFFTISGFLASYVLFSRGLVKKINTCVWSYLFFHRYWRLAPLYLLTFWFVKSVAHQLGDGPLWDYATTNLTFRGLCANEPWSIPLTLTSNLQGIFNECMITTWYISCDMQFWLVSPVFIYLLSKSPLAGWLSTVAAILASVVLRYQEVIGKQSPNDDLFHLELTRPRADIFIRVGYDLQSIYTLPQYRIAPYLVGLLAGHYVYLFETKQLKSNLTTSAKTKRILSILGIFGVLIVSVLALASWILFKFYPTSLEPMSRSISAVLYSIDHLIMGIGASLIIVTLAMGQWYVLARKMSSPFWIRLSRLNYTLLLLQCEAIYLEIFCQSHVPVAGTQPLINYMLTLVFTLYPMALFLTIALEYPLTNLEKHYIAARIMKKDRQPKSKIDNKTSQTRIQSIVHQEEQLKQQKNISCPLTPPPTPTSKFVDKLLHNDNELSTNDHHVDHDNIVIQRKQQLHSKLL